MLQSISLLALGVAGALAQGPIGPINKWSASGMEHFVTRPELIAPRYKVNKIHPDAIAPGYWFVTPYYVTAQEQRKETLEYIPCQTGAHIFDGDGNLVWSGACQYENRNIFGFRPVEINGTQHLSMWLSRQFIGMPKETIPLPDRSESGVVLNNQYNEISRLILPHALDCHEFHPQPDGKTILHTWHERIDVDTTGSNLPHLQDGETKRLVLNGGFWETDVNTHEPVFAWSPLEHGMHLNESYDTTGGGWVGTDDHSDAWDYIHMNAVDKTTNGDYICSGRHTCAVYKVSKDDGHIMWRLGGKRSDFVMDDDVPFWWPHHVAFLADNETHTIISVFDNAGEDKGRNTSIPNQISKAKLIVLDTSSTPMTAKILRNFERPDGERTPMGGSVFPLGPDPATANIFVNWVIPGYVSEYDSNDRLILEARFETDNVKGYRAFKSDFVGMPSEPPAFKVLPVGYGKDEAASAFYVSWNGATEVCDWVFYGAETRGGPFSKIATVKKRGFETSWVTPGVVQWAYAEGIDKNGRSLGKSGVESIVWHGDGKYRIAAPALDGIKETASPLDGAPVEGSSSSSSTAQGDTLAPSTPSSPSAALQQASAYTFLIYCLAAWGLFSGLRKLYSIIYFRRKGYMAVPAFKFDVEAHSPPKSLD